MLWPNRIQRAAVPIVFLLMSALLGCTSDKHCGASSEAVVIARELSREDASVLYDRVKNFAQKYGRGTYTAGDDAPIPTSFPNYEDITLILKGETIAYMYLDVCSLDHKVVLVFDMPENEAGEVILQWGGDSESWGSVVLWP